MTTHNGIPTSPNDNAYKPNNLDLAISYHPLISCNCLLIPVFIGIWWYWVRRKTNVALQRLSIVKQQSQENCCSSYQPPSQSQTSHEQHHQQSSKKFPLISTSTPSAPTPWIETVVAVNQHYPQQEDCSRNWNHDQRESKNTEVLKPTTIHSPISVDTNDVDPFHTWYVYICNSKYIYL